MRTSEDFDSAQLNSNFPSPVGGVMSCARRITSRVQYSIGARHEKLRGADNGCGFTRGQRHGDGPCFVTAESSLLICPLRTIWIPVPISLSGATRPFAK